MKIYEITDQDVAYIEEALELFWAYKPDEKDEPILIRVQEAIRWVGKNESTEHLCYKGQYI